MPGPLLAADLPWLLYRGHFSLPSSIRGADDRPVNALLGAVNALLAAVEACSPRVVVACFGVENAVYRTAAFPAYHAHRDPMPDPLAWQWERAPGLLRALGWEVADTDELEADDLLGAYAAVEADAGGEALLLTGDRDLYQCVSDRVRILLPVKGGGFEQFGPAEVEQRCGVPPALVPDLIALRGDPSDGIPGAKGIGAKTAVSLLRRHGSLDEVIATADTQSPRFASALTVPEVAMFKDVATLRPPPVDRPADRETDRAGGAAAARELGMRRLADRLAASEG